MPFYKGNKKIQELYFNNKKIYKLYKGPYLVYRGKIIFPTKIPFPSNYTETQVARVDGANSSIYNVTKDAYYRIQVSAGGGGTAHKNGTITYAGGTNQIVYLFEGSKCLLWGGSHGWPGEVSGAVSGSTGYPSPSDALGGTGANRAAGESGGNGGSASNNGTWGTYQGGHGGGGAGFLAGTNHRVYEYSHNEEGWANPIKTTNSWSAGNFSVTNLYCYILCGGAGGNCSNNGSHRSGGCGGGAYGDSGNNYDWAPGYGPGGTWGKGGNSYRYSAGGAGAWCIMDFSRNLWNWGTGGGAASNTDGFCILTRLDPA